MILGGNNDILFAISSNMHLKDYNCPTWWLDRGDNDCRMKLTLLSSWIYESMELYLCPPTSPICQIFRCKYTICEEVWVLLQINDCKLRSQSSIPSFTDSIYWIIGRMMFLTHIVFCTQTEILYTANGLKTYCKWPMKFLF